MQAGGGALAHRIKPGQRGTALGVRHQATHVVVRSGRHGNGLHARVDARRLACREYGRKFFGESRAYCRTGIQRRAPPCHAFRMNGAGDYIARGKVASGVVALHEGLAIGVHQQRAMAAEGFRDQRRGALLHIECSGVELHELQVAQLRARTPASGQRHALGGVGVGGYGVKAAQATSSQHGGGAIVVAQRGLNVAVRGIVHFTA